MGQAKLRGSKAQRMTEAVERTRIEEIARKAKKMADSRARSDELAAKQADWEMRNAERLVRGDEPLPQLNERSIRLPASTLLAVALAGMLSQPMMR